MKYLTVATFLLLSSANAQAVPSTNRVCGGTSGLTCFGSVYGPCCNAQNVCTASTGACTVGNGCQTRYGQCGIATTLVKDSPGTFRPPSTNNRCGPRNGGQACSTNCCRKFGSAFGASGGTCGSGAAYCGSGNCELGGYGYCYGTPPQPTPSSVPIIPPTGPPADSAPFCLISSDNNKVVKVNTNTLQLETGDAAALAPTFVLTGYYRNLQRTADLSFVALQDDSVTPINVQSLITNTVLNRARLSQCILGAGGVNGGQLTCQATTSAGGGITLNRFAEQTPASTPQDLFLTDAVSATGYAPVTLTAQTGDFCGAGPPTNFCLKDSTTLNYLVLDTSNGNVDQYKLVVPGMNSPAAARFSFDASGRLSTAAAGTTPGTPIVIANPQSRNSVFRPGTVAAATPQLQCTSTSNVISCPQTFTTANPPVTYVRFGQDTNGVVYDVDNLSTTATTAVTLKEFFGSDCL